MRLSTHIALLSGLALGLLTACGSGSGTSGSTSAATSSSSGMGGGGGSMSTSTSSTGAGGNPNLYNKCDPATAEDHLADAAVEIKFGDAVGFKYSPACIKVKSGTMVTFTGNTLIHPLDAGEVIGTTIMVDPTSPIKPTIDGTKPSVTFAIEPAGTWGFFCDEHYAGGMQGAIFAE